MKVALKEWAVVVEALASGCQMFLLRKGGIAEGKRGFELKHQEFVFFPTWEHQHADLVRPEYRALFEQVKPPDSERLEIRHYAQVSDIFRAPPSMEDFCELSAYHIWAEPYIQMRYEYRPDLPLYLVIVRAWRLEQPVIIPNDRRYGGCRSWVDLYEDVPVKNLTPVPTKDKFQAARNELLDKLSIATGTES